MDRINYLEQNQNHEDLSDKFKRYRGSAGNTSNKLQPPIMVTRAIVSAGKHGINLLHGTANNADGNCAFDSIISNINDRQCFPEKLELSSTDYRQIWVTEFEMESYKYPNLGAGYSETEKHDKWNQLRHSGVYEVDYFGDLVLYAIAKGCKKNILIFNTSVDADDPIYVIMADEYGGTVDTDIPVVVAYNQVHYESMHPITQEDIEKTKLLMNSYITGNYEYTKNDIPYLISNSRREAISLKTKCVGKQINIGSQSEFPPLPLKKQNNSVSRNPSSQKIPEISGSLKERLEELKSIKAKKRSAAERKEIEKLRKTISRENENEYQRKSRLENDLKRHISAKESETPEEKKSRLVNNCRSQRKIRASETEAKKNIKTREGA